MTQIFLQAEKTPSFISRLQKLKSQNCDEGNCFWQFQGRKYLISLLSQILSTHIWNALNHFGPENNPNSEDNPLDLAHKHETNWAIFVFFQ